MSLERKTPLRRTPLAPGEGAQLRRTPLARSGKGLAPGKPLEARKRLKPMSDKRRSEVDARAALRRRVLARDRNRCQAHERGAPGRCWHPSDLADLDVHEVIPRQAWSAGYLVDENCLAICRRAHSWLHGEPLLAQSMGLLVPGFVFDTYGLVVLDFARELRDLARGGRPHLAPWLSDFDRVATTPRVPGVRLAPLKGWPPDPEPSGLHRRPGSTTLGGVPTTTTEEP